MNCESYWLWMITNLANALLWIVLRILTQDTFPAYGYDYYSNGYYENQQQQQPQPQPPQQQQHFGYGYPAAYGYGYPAAYGKFCSHFLW